MPYSALIEEGPEAAVAYFHELPGCVVTAPTVDALLPELQPAVISHLRWLERWGLGGSPQDDTSVVVGERLPVDPASGAGPIFNADRLPLDDAYIEAALRVCELARAELMQLYSGLPMERRNEPQAPGEWSAGEHLLHVAESELWYLAAFEEKGEGISVVLPEDPVAALEVSAAHVEATLRNLSDSRRDGIFTRGPAQWTAAKMLRRMAGHLRDHFSYIASRE